MKPSDRVADLRGVIAASQRYNFAATKLKLYLVKEGATWLSPAHEDAKALRRGEVLALVTSRLSKDLRMDGTTTIRDSISEAGLLEDLLTRVAALVTNEEKVAAAAPVPQRNWKDEVDPVYSVLNDELLFMNRTNAVAQLQVIHKGNHSRADSSCDADWVVPIAGNVVDLGKWVFAAHYIRKCREAWADGDA